MSPRVSRPNAQPAIRLPAVECDKRGNTGHDHAAWHMAFIYPSSCPNRSDRPLPSRRRALICSGVVLPGGYRGRPVDPAIDSKTVALFGVLVVQLAAQAGAGSGRLLFI